MITSCYVPITNSKYLSHFGLQLRDGAKDGGFGGESNRTR